MPGCLKDTLRGKLSGIAGALRMAYFSLLTACRWLETQHDLHERKELLPAMLGAQGERPTWMLFAEAAPWRKARYGRREGREETREGMLGTGQVRGYFQGLL